MTWFILGISLLSLILVIKFFNTQRNSKNLGSNITKHNNEFNSIDEWVKDTYEQISGRKLRHQPTEEQVLRRDVELAKEGKIKVEEIGTGLYDQRILINDLIALDKDLYFIGTYNEDQWYDIQKCMWDAEKLAKKNKIDFKTWLNNNRLYVIEKIYDFSSSYSGFTDGIQKYKEYRSQIDDEINNIDYLNYLLNSHPVYYFDYYEDSIREGIVPNMDLRQHYRRNLYSFIVIRLNTLPKNETPDWFINTDTEKRTFISGSISTTKIQLNKTQAAKNSILKLFADTDLLIDVVNNCHDELLKTAFTSYKQHYLKQTI